MMYPACESEEYIMRQSPILVAYSKLSASQQERIRRVVTDLVNMNEQLESQKPEVCPYCEKQSKMIRKGCECGKQKYQCKECGHKFVWDSHTITANLKISRDEFLEICLDTLGLVPIKETAARLDRSVQCVFENRHKFLIVLEEILKEEDQKLSGTIEFDGTYVLESVKGKKPRTRKARHRGEPSNFRGISHEQICIVTTTDRTGHEIFRAVSRAKPTSTIITKTFGQSIINRSVFYTDGITVYDELAEHCNSKIVYLIGHESYNKVEHLNTVNSIHSTIKYIFRKYRGVASKYLNRYMSMFVFFRRFQDMDRNEKTELLINKIKWHHCHITRWTLRNAYLFAY